MRDQEEGSERGLGANRTELGSEGVDFSSCFTAGLLCYLGHVLCPLWASVSPFCNTWKLSVADPKGSSSPDPLGFFRRPWKSEMSSPSKRGINGGPSSTDGEFLFDPL